MINVCVSFNKQTIAIINVPPIDVPKDRQYTIFAKRLIKPKVQSEVTDKF